MRSDIFYRQADPFPVPLVCTSIDCFQQDTAIIRRNPDRQLTVRGFHPEWLCLHEARGLKNRHHFLSDLFSPTARVVRTFYAASTIVLYDGYRALAIRRARPVSCLAQRSHRRSKSCKGSLQHHASQGCLWYRQRPLGYDKSAFPPITRRRSSGSHSSRIRWPMKRITSRLGCLALIYVGPSTAV